ncbi:ABC transporter substrate-binding protein [Pleomorphomonas oryzae]|uniref:ABC transporter substrate-binding protein n=1 Tax=Pleomorphomonas oryzae TaxID=261934 RepID=UPI000684D514|nr:ABC transporter substrate-binding protein [Pleomorphomonas oryzae]
MHRLALAGVSCLVFALTGSASFAADKVTLTYMASQDWVKDAEQTLAKKFEEKTGIAIDFQILPSGQYFNVLQTKLNSGEGPDLFGGQSGVTDLKLQYNVEKNAVDLTNEPWATKEDKLVAAQSTLGGKLYGLTYWDVLGNTWVISYNKKLFAQYGLSEPKTYAEFKAACQKLLDNGVQPIYEPVADGWHHVLWFPELGPRFEQVTPGLADALNANKATFAGNPTMLSAVTELKEMFDLGYMGKNALADVYTGASKAMASGKVGMVLANTGFGSLVEHDYPDMKASDIGVFLMPLADNQQVNINPAGPTHFIYSGSAHVDAAKQYLAFLAEPENVDYFIDNTPTAMTLPFDGAKSKFSPDVQALFDSHKDARGTVYQTAVAYVNPQWMDLGADLTAMFTGSMGPDKVLANIDKRRADLAKAARDPAWKK